MIANVIVSIVVAIVVATVKKTVVKKTVVTVVDVKISSSNAGAFNSNHTMLSA